MTTGFGAFFSGAFRASLGLALALLLFLAVFFAGQKNPDRFLGQVHHVAIGSLDQVVAAQIFVDCFRLGWRFDDNQ